MCCNLHSIGWMRDWRAAKTVLQRVGGKLSTDAIEILITNSIHAAFIKYPEGDGSPSIDYEWIPADQSAHIAKSILLDLEANGYHVATKG